MVRISWLIPMKEHLPDPGISWELPQHCAGHATNCPIMANFFSSFIQKRYARTLIVKDVLRRVPVNLSVISLYLPA